MPSLAATATAASGAPSPVAAERPADPSRSSGDGAKSRGRPAWIYGAALVPVALVIWMFTRDGEPAASPAADTTTAVAPETGGGTGTPGTGDSGRVASADSTTVPVAAPTTDSGGTTASGGTTGALTGAGTGSTGVSVLRVDPLRQTTLKVSEVVTLGASIVDGASGRSTRGTIQFRSSNQAVARVNDRGVVTAVAPGKVTITVDAGAAGRRTVALTIAAADVAVRTEIEPPVTPPKPPVVTTNPPKRDSVPAVNPSAPVPVAVSQLQLASEARTAVDGYFRALESMDIARVRSVYPGISASDASELAEMFKFSRSVQFTVRSVNVASGSGSYEAAVGSRTDVRVGVRFSQTPSSRGVKAQPPTESVWAVTLQREGSGWRIVQVTPQ